MNETLTKIAKDHLDLETLVTRGSDRLDFQPCWVGHIAEALQEAFLSGSMFAGVALASRMSRENLAHVLNALLCIDDDEKAAEEVIQAGQIVFDKISSLRPEAVAIAQGAGPDPQSDANYIRRLRDKIGELRADLDQFKARFGPLPITPADKIGEVMAGLSPSELADQQWKDLVGLLESGEAKPSDFAEFWDNDFAMKVADLWWNERGIGLRSEG